MSSSNQYLANILNPFHTPAVPIPDEHRQATVVKTLLSTDTFNTPSANDNIMLVMYPHSPRRQIRIYKLEGEFWRYFGCIVQEQDLSLNYDYLRPISSGMMLKSSTISGTKFNIAGIVNAVITQASSDISAYTFKNILSFGRSNMDKVAGVSIADGVAFCAYPGDYLYRTPVTIEDLNPKSTVSSGFSDTSDSTYYVRFPQLAMPSSVVAAGTNWFTATANSAGTTTALETFRQAFRNRFGRVKIRALFSMVAGGAGKYDLTLKVKTVKGDYKTWTNAENTREYISTAYTAATGAIVTFEFDDELNLDSELLEFQVSASASNPAGLTPLGSASSFGLFLEFTEEYDIQTSASAMVAILTGVDPANQVVVDAINSYELVPNSELSRNLPLLPIPETNILKLEVATEVPC